MDLSCIHKSKTSRLSLIQLTQCLCSPYFDQGVSLTAIPSARIARLTVTRRLDLFPEDVARLYSKKKNDLEHIIRGLRDLTAQR